MAQKTKVKVVVEQGVKVGGAYPPVGSPIELEKNEAERLLALGAASLPRPPSEPVEEAEQPGPEAPAEAELIAAIEAAATEDELAALVAGDETRPAVLEAASAKLEVLTQPAPATSAKKT